MACYVKELEEKNVVLLFSVTHCSTVPVNIHRHSQNRILKKSDQTGSKEVSLSYNEEEECQGIELGCECYKL